MSDLKNPYQAAGYGEHVRNAWDEGTKAERARICEWLRNHTLWRQRDSVSGCDDVTGPFADAIESGQHVKGGG